ncbi:MAG: hypothetical protein B7Z73_11600 [Planctomycetia bacterium 21-64-5]|nr:MAG: hypothetical protein B7Z73_11600 [Planctomycetia bacterium 21-64-5]
MQELAVAPALGNTVKELRVKAGLSQEALADRARIHRTYVSQLERGLKSPTISVLLRIAEALATPASSIIQRIEKLPAGEETSTEKVQSQRRLRSRSRL